MLVNLPQAPSWNVSNGMCPFTTKSGHRVRAEWPNSRRFPTRSPHSDSAQHHGAKPTADTPQRPNEVDDADTWFQVHSNSTVNVRSEHISHCSTHWSVPADGSNHCGGFVGPELAPIWLLSNGNPTTPHRTDPQRGVNTDCRRCGARATPHWRAEWRPARHWKHTASGTTVSREHVSVLPLEHDRSLLHEVSHGSHSQTW